MYKEDSCRHLSLTFNFILKLITLSINLQIIIYFKNELILIKLFLKGNIYKFLGEIL